MSVDPPEPESTEDVDHRFEKLLAAARSGSTEARDELFRQLQTYLGFVASQHRNDRLAAKVGISDVVQQSMMYAAEEFSGFRGGTIEQFRGWLRQILINEIRSLHRHYSAQRRNAMQEIGMDDDRSRFPSIQELSDQSPSPSREMMVEEDSERIRRAVEQLPEEMRQVVQLRNWEGLQFQAIADRLGISISRAAKLWYNALVEIERIHAQQK